MASSSELSYRPRRPPQSSTDELTISEFSDVLQIRTPGIRKTAQNILFGVELLYRLIGI